MGILSLLLRLIEISQIRRLLSPLGNGWTPSIDYRPRQNLNTQGNVAEGTFTPQGVTGDP